MGLHPFHGHPPSPQGAGPHDRCCQGGCCFTGHKRLPFGDRVAVAGLALVSRSRQFAQALLTEVKRLQAHDDRMQTTIIIGIPMLVAKRLGTLEAGAVTPERRLGGGARKAPNYDAASWNVGKATGDLVNMAVLAGSMFGRQLRERPVTYEHVVKLVGRTSCRRLIVNHFVQTFRALGWFTAETEETKVQSSTNANDFARSFGRWHLHKPEVNKHLESLGCKPIRRARDFVLDALCINIKFTEITVSLPLLMCSSWPSPVDASAVAHSLFLLFVQEELQPPSTCLMPMVVQHKKEEVELQNELFVEAQCRSDRPGFGLVDPDDRQVFKLYNAMALQQ